MRDFEKRTGEEKHVDDMRKAELMAYAEAPYREFESNARQAGLADVAGELALKATAEGEKAGSQYDIDRTYVRKSVMDLVEAAKIFDLEQDREQPAGVYETGPLTDEVLKTIYGALGCSEPEDRGLVKCHPTRYLKGSTFSELKSIFLGTEPDYLRQLPYVTISASVAERTASNGMLVRELRTDDNVVLSFDPMNAMRSQAKIDELVGGWQEGVDALKAKSSLSAREREEIVKHEAKTLAEQQAEAANWDIDREKLYYIWPHEETSD